jgi:4-amino-4-deoxy-L-arabinose transferase-like glycosyltransferase
MTPNDAQASLEDIHRRQDQTREEYVRHSSSRRHALVLGLALFAVLASADLRSPWSGVAVGLGFGLIAAVAVAQGRKSLVRRRQRGAELMLLVGVVGGLIVAISVFSLITGVLNHAFGLPAPHTIAGAAVALLYIAINELSRPLYRAIVRRD